MTCEIIKQENYYIFHYTPIMHGLEYWYELNKFSPERLPQPTSWEQIIRNPGDLFSRDSGIAIPEILSKNILMTCQSGYNEFLALYKMKKDVNLHFILPDINIGKYDLTKQFNVNLAKLCMWKEVCKFIIGINISIIIWKDSLPTNIDTLITDSDYKFLANYCLIPGGQIYTNSISAIKLHNLYAWNLYEKLIFQKGLTIDTIREINDIYFKDMFSIS